MPTETIAHEIVSTIRSYYDQSRSKRKPRLRNWERNHKVVHNQTWTTGRPSWMPDSRVSETFPILAALAGWMTDQQPNFEVTPSADPHTAFFEVESKLALDLQKLMESLWVTHDWASQVEQVIWDAMICGTGFFKVVWDPAADGGLGNPKVCRIDPWKIFPDPNADSWESMSFIIERNRMSLDELDRRYGPGSSVKIEGAGGSETMGDERPDPFSGGKEAPMANPGAMPGSTSSSYGRPGEGRDHASMDNGVVVLEAWLRENDLWLDDDGEEYIQDRWRFVATCGDVILADEKVEDLWGYATHPYARFVMQDLGEVYGIALVDHLYNAQDSINRLLSSLQNNAELTGNPVFVEDTRAGISRTALTNKPGTRLRKNPQGEAQWMEPPPPPAYVMELIQFWEAAMERISGLSAIVRGFGPNQRTAQGVMDQVQESAFVRVRAALRNLERALRQVGEMEASLIVENYTAPRTVAIVGPEGEQTAMALSTRHFFTPGETESTATPMKYQLWVRAGSAMPTSRQARAMEADTLFGLNAIDRQAVLDAHDYPNRAQIVERMKEQDMLGFEQGGGARQRARRGS